MTRSRRVLVCSTLTSEIKNLQQAFEQDIQFYAVEVSLIFRRQNKNVELRILPTLIAEKTFEKLIAPHIFQLLKSKEISILSSVNYKEPKRFMKERLTLAL